MLKQVQHDKVSYFNKVKIKDIKMDLIEKEIVILGSGAAGLQAAIYAARRKTEVFVVGKSENSSLFWAEVENFFGLIEKSSGKELLGNAKKQAKNFGAEFLEEDVISVHPAAGGRFLITLESDKQISAKAIIISSGVSRQKLGIKGESEFVGKGVSYCVDCDGMFFRNKTVAITGNGSSAANSALTLANYTSAVYFIFDELAVADELKQKIFANPKIKVFEAKKIKEIQGENFVKKIVLNDETELEVNGVFIELGAKGAFELFSDFGIELDPETFKHIKTNAKQETNVKGIFAAGDICGAPYQVAKSVGQGCVSGLAAAEFVKK